MSEETFETPQTTPSTEPKPTNRTKIVLTSVLGLGLLVSAAYTGYWYSTQQVQQPEKPTLVVSQPTPEPTIVSAADWTEYVDETGGYSISYPSHWYPNERCYLVEHSEDYACFATSDFRRVKTGVVFGDGGVEEKRVEKGALVLAVKVDQEQLYPYSKQGFCSPGGPFYISNCGEDFLNGKRIAVRELGNPADEKDILFIQEGWVLVNLVLYFSPEERDEYLNIFDQILSTFQFLEVEDQTKGWKTYTNTGSGFLLKYPDSYFKFQGDSPLLTFFAATSAPQGGNSPKFLGKNDVWLSAVSSSENITSLDQYLKSAPDYYKNAQKTPVVIDGINGLEMVYTLMVGPTAPLTPQYVYEVLIIKNGKLYAISMASWTKNILDSSQALFDQILSTFKFLD